MLTRGLIRFARSIVWPIDTAALDRHVKWMQRYTAIQGRLVLIALIGCRDYIESHSTSH